MNLRHKSDIELVADAKNFRREELDHLATLLHYSLEIERRDLHFAARYSSMNEYLKKEFGYSKDEASFRVSAMRLFQSVPEVELELRSGRITLTHLARTQKACKKEDQRRKKAGEAALTHDEKLELLEKIKRKDPDDFDALLAEEFPELNLEPEILKPVSATHSLMKLHLKNEIVEKIKRLLDLTAHTNFERSLEVFLDDVTEIALDKLDPFRRQARREKRKEAGQQRKEAGERRQSPREKRRAASQKQKNAAEESKAADDETNAARAKHKTASERGRTESARRKDPNDDLRSRATSRDGSRTEKRTTQHSSDDIIYASGATVAPQENSEQTDSIESFQLKNNLPDLRFHSGRKTELEGHTRVAPVRPTDVDAPVQSIDPGVPVHSTDLGASERPIDPGVPAQPTGLGAPVQPTDPGVPVQFQSSPAPKRARRPYQKISLRDAVYIEDEGRCTYRNSETGERCSAMHATQVDHCVPFALGGLETRENLRLVCAAHNQCLARKLFEKSKRTASHMSQFHGEVAT